MSPSPPITLSPAPTSNSTTNTVITTSNYSNNSNHNNYSNYSNSVACNVYNKRTSSAEFNLTIFISVFILTIKI